MRPEVDDPLAGVLKNKVKTMIEHLYKFSLFRRLTADGSGGRGYSVARPQRARLALLVDESTRSSMAKHLQRDYEIVVPRGARLAPDSFDLAIVDLDGFKLWRTQLADEKARQSPTLLPVVLTLSPQELSHRFDSCWSTIDEFFVWPMDPREFRERLNVFVRSRKLAIEHDMKKDAGGLEVSDKSLFLETLADSIRDASVLGREVHTAVVRISMSRIRQSLGHHGLERAAARCSARLVGLLEPDIHIARLTTEEWGLVWKAGEEQTSVVGTCERIQQIANEPIEVNGEHVHLSPRIGIGVYPNDGADANNVLNSAMAALYDARSTTPTFYSSNIQHKALRFIRTQARLHEALEKQQFELWYQPQLNLSTGRLSGVEALIRWRLPDGNLVPPVEFIPVAESTGQIAAIDRWVLEHTCAAMQGWRRRKINVPRASVNITVADVESPDFVEFVQDSLVRYGLTPDDLELEITETAMLEASPVNLEKLHRLRDHGIKIAVDDFGTGYSSLGYLHKLPVTTLKIDKAFVDNVISSHSDSRIAETIVWLARKFNLDTVAEGIETEDQAEFLRGLQVTTAQGYLYGRPMPEQQMLEWIEHHEAAFQEALA